MNNIPRKLRKQLSDDPYYQFCARAGIYGHFCAGRVTWEHAVMHKGRQLQAWWAILPLCAKGHSVDFHQDGGDLDKEVNVWIALNRASESELQAVSGAVDYQALKERLNARYGAYSQPLYEEVEINYSFLRTV